jgi:hypothetical protein
LGLGLGLGLGLDLGLDLGLGLGLDLGFGLNVLLNQIWRQVGFLDKEIGSHQADFVWVGGEVRTANNYAQFVRAH